MRRRLMKSALRIFARDGFEAARIEDIASDSGHTRGAFYAHFESKEDLFFALLEEQTRDYLRKLEQGLLQSRNTRERLDVLCDYFASRISDRQWVLLMLEFKLFALRRPRLRPRLAGMHRRIRQSLKLEFIKRLILPGTEGDPVLEEPIRASLEAILSGLVLENAFDPTRLPDDQLIVMLRKLFNFLVRDALL